MAGGLTVIVPSLTPGQVVFCIVVVAVGAGPFATIILFTVPAHPIGLVKVAVYVPGASPVNVGLLF